MTGLEIKQLIDENNKLLLEFKNNIFTLNKRKQEIMNENLQLQNKCSHEFVNHRCKFCYKEES